MNTSDIPSGSPSSYQKLNQLLKRNPIVSTALIGFAICLIGVAVASYYLVHSENKTTALEIAVVLSFVAVAVALAAFFTALVAVFRRSS